MLVSIIVAAAEHSTNGWEAVIEIAGYVLLGFVAWLFFMSRR